MFSNPEILFQMRNILYPHFDTPLKKTVDKLSQQVINFIGTDKKISCVPMPLLKDVFNLRMKYLKWLSTEATFNYMRKLDEIYPQIQSMRGNEYFNVLVENILFAIRCNKRVTGKLFKKLNTTEEKFIQQTSNIKTLSYDGYITELSKQIPNDTILQKMVDWVNASLQIEFVIIAADIIHSEKLTVKNKNINQLAFIIADSAQLYSAIAMEMRLIGCGDFPLDCNEEITDAEFIKEQKYLADSGLSDFETNF